MLNTRLTCSRNEHFYDKKTWKNQSLAYLYSNFKYHKICFSLFFCNTGSFLLCIPFILIMYISHATTLLQYRSETYIGWWLCYLLNVVMWSKKQYVAAIHPYHYLGHNAEYRAETFISFWTTYIQGKKMRETNLFFVEVYMRYHQTIQYVCTCEGIFSCATRCWLLPFSLHNTFWLGYY